MWNPIVAAAILGVLSYAAYRCVTGRSRALEESFRREVVRDAATWLSGKLGAPAAEIERSLEELAAGGPADPQLDAVLRIECEVTRAADRATYRRKVAVMLRNGGRILLGEDTRGLPWGALPRQVRMDFLRRGGERQTYLVVPRSAAPGRSAGRVGAAN
jgi:hypothetical protein